MFYLNCAGAISWPEVHGAKNHRQDSYSVKLHLRHKRTNGKTEEETRPSLRWSLTHTLYKSQ